MAKKKEEPNVTQLAAFIQANMRDVGHRVSGGTSMLIANIVTDYLALYDIKVRE